jgi:hypothetical protein
VTIGQITIYCAAPSHDRREAEIAICARDAHGRWDISRQFPDPERRFRYYRHVEDGPITEAVTYTFRCPLCPLTAAVRHSTIVPLLDKAAAAGKARVSLRVLSSTISTKSQD